MKNRWLILGLAATGVVSLLSLTQQIADAKQPSPMGSKSGKPTHRPDVFDPQPVTNKIGSNGAVAPECSEAPEAFIHLHIREQFFSNLSPRDICNISASGSPVSCISTSMADPSGKMDDDGSESAELPGTPRLTATSQNWDTPLDIDLSGYWKVYGKKGTIQIKIILDDTPNMIFLFRNGNLPTNPTDALKQGLEGNKMFQCRSDVHLADSAGPASITIRAKYEKGYGGLNIGVIYNVGNLKLPLYIDPRVHSDG
jgi:hypothetical protein